MSGTRPRSVAGTPPFGDDPRRACAGKDPNLFCPPEGATRTRVKSLQQRAKAICATCPRDIHTACLVFALATHQNGIWAGTDDNDRDAQRRPADRAGSDHDDAATPTRVPAATIDQLDRGTLSAREIARRLDISSRTVIRQRTRRRAQAMGSTVDERGAA